MNVGDIIKNQVFETEQPQYFIVSALYRNIPNLEPIEDYIMRNFTVLYSNGHYTLKEVLESEKQKIIKEYEKHVQTN